MEQENKVITISAMVNMAIEVEVKHTGDGQGEIVCVRNVTGMPTSGDIVNALDAADDLAQLDVFEADTEGDSDPTGYDPDEYRFMTMHPGWEGS